MELKADFNSFVAPGATPTEPSNVQVVLTVSAGADGMAGAVSIPADVALVLDVSGSMEGAKLERAKSGAARAVQHLAATSRFLLVAFNDHPTALVDLAPASAANLEHAVQRIQGMRAGGGTLMSKALEVARQQLANSERPKKLLFITDGDDNAQDLNDLWRLLPALAESRIPVTAWGIGDDWKVSLLERVARETGGSADGIPHPEAMDSMLTTWVGAASDLVCQQVRLRLQTFLGGQVLSVQQVFPEFAELSRAALDGRTSELYLGDFTRGESREYLVQLSVAPKPLGQRAMVLHPLLSGQTAAGPVAAEAQVVVQWSEDLSLTSRIDPRVAHYTRQEQLAAEITAGLAALDKGDAQGATAHLSQAIKRAQQAGNTQLLSSLQRVVTVDPSGTVRLNPGATAGERKTLALQKGKTARLQ